MKPNPAGAAAPPWVARLCAVLVAGALGLAVFYQGPQIPLLAGAQFLLVTWVALSLTYSHVGGVPIPRTPLSVSLALFWFWLGISLSWSHVPVTSTLNFWWVGSLALVFWAYTLSPQRERIWSFVSRFAVIGALALCTFALVQLFVLHEPPRATFVNIHSFAALMMLIALSLGGYFLIAWHNRASGPVRYGIAVCLFILYFTIASTEGRGTSLSILLSLLVFTVIAVRLAAFRPVLTLVGLVVGAYVAANLVLHGGWGDRMATMADPASAAFPRLLIWRGSWEMLMRQPWWGIGLGTYYLAWPPFRSPVDNTLGFFAHNDYLQLWIEAGLPALLLLLAVFVSVLVMLIRLLRYTRAPAALHLEAVGLFAGLLAVAAHSFVDFNFYILSISVAAGLALGRFHECVISTVAAPTHVLTPASSMRRGPYRLTVALLALFPLLYFIALGSSDYLYRRGFVLASQGQLVEADNAFSWAERLVPHDDKVLTMHADLYRHVIAHLSPSESAKRRSLYEAALRLVDEAQSANPYRSLVHVVRGRILRENPELTGPDWRERAESEYRKALDLNPRFFATRMDYAELLLASGRTREAYRILNAGVNYWYYPSKPVLTYYGFVADVARKVGDSARVAEVERKMDALRQAIARTAAARPVVSDLSPPATAASR